jgi:hypothetical protein
MATDRDLTVRVAKATAAAIAVGAAAFGVWQVRSVLILLLLAITFAAAIRPGVEWPRPAPRAGVVRDPAPLSPERVADLVQRGRHRQPGSTGSSPGFRRRAR